MKPATVFRGRQLAWMFGSVIALGLLMAASSVRAQSSTPPYYPAGTYTQFSSLEAINSNGASAFMFPADGSPITVMGIVLNNPSDMLDTTPNSNTVPYDLGGQWQIFIQAYSDSTVGGMPGDFGGAEVWMGQCYGNLPFIGDPNDVYSNSQWSTVVADLNHPPLWPGGSSGTISLQESGSSNNGSPAVWPSSGTVSLQAGDVVAITSYGLEYEGMVNVNQQHMVGSPVSITVLETGATLPTPTTTTLNQLMNSNGNFYFDPTRQTGAEHLQGTLVQLDGVRVVSGTWAPGNDVMITDGSLRQMELQIGANSNLTVAPTGAFNVTGIEDQESTDGSNTDGYTLWLTDSAGVSLLPNSGGTFNWTGASGSWNAAANWNLGGKPQNPGDVAILGGSLAVAATVTLDGPQTAGGLIFANANAATTGYTLSQGLGGTLTLDNSGSAATITVTSGSHVVAAPIALADDLVASVAASSSLALAGGIGENSSGLSLTEQGEGLLVLDGASHYTGGTTVSGGTLLVESADALADGTSLIVGDASAFSAPTGDASTGGSGPAISSVPEPGTLAIFAAGLAAFAFHDFKRRFRHG